MKTFRVYAKVMGKICAWDVECKEGEDHTHAIAAVMKETGSRVALTAVK